jgi:tetraacyldisaccharide 4'-kinase
LTALSRLYGRATTFRRSWYARDRSRSRRLLQPVISVGNLVLGGSGKTPIVATLARMLVAAGERPSILSRGYRRPDPSRGVVVVCDGHAVLATAERSGDEPFMLARMLAGAAVLVSHDRYEAGTIAESRFGCTVHILDDGFQHVQLARDVNLLVAAPADLNDRVLPAGTLREPLSAARAADAVFVEGSDDDVQAVASGLGVSTAFRVTRRFQPVRRLRSHAVQSAVGADLQVGRNVTPARAIAVAAIARPERFFAALRDQGWDIARQLTFRDHHWFTAQDIQTIEQAARDAGVEVVITTEKDAARLDATVGRRALSGSPGGPDKVRPTWALLPMEAQIDDRFAPWLAGRLAAARRHRSGPAPSTSAGPG